jgi:CheY-like chemotaxis protein
MQSRDVAGQTDLGMGIGESAQHPVLSITQPGILPQVALARGGKVRKTEASGSRLHKLAGRQHRSVQATIARAIENGPVVLPSSLPNSVSESGAHSMPEQDSHADELDKSARRTLSPREKASHSVATPGGPSAGQGSQFITSASLTLRGEAGGVGPEENVDGTPAHAAPAAAWNCSGLKASTAQGTGAVLATEYEHKSESILADSRMLDALATRGFSLGGGPNSLLRGMTLRILADTIFANLPGNSPALAMSAVGIRLGNDGPADSAANSGTQPLETTSGATLGFMLAGALTIHLGSQAERPTLLLVVSDEDTRDSMTVMLFAEGYQVVAVANGRDAWNVLRSPFAPINMMLLDVHLPDISGVHLVQRLRQNYPRLPVFAWMNGSEPAEVARLGELGVHHYRLAQAAEFSELVESVRAFLRGASPHGRTG